MLIALLWARWPGPHARSRCPFDDAHYLYVFSGMGLTPGAVGASSPQGRPPGTFPLSYAALPRLLRGGVQNAPGTDEASGVVGHAEWGDLDSALGAGGVDEGAIAQRHANMAHLAVHPEEH